MQGGFDQGSEFRRCIICRRSVLVLKCQVGLQTATPRPRRQGVLPVNRLRIIKVCIPKNARIKTAIAAQTRYIRQLDVAIQSGEGTPTVRDRDCLVLFVLALETRRLSRASGREERYYIESGTRALQVFGRPSRNESGAVADVEVKTHWTVRRG